MDTACCVFRFLFRLLWALSGQMIGNGPGDAFALGSVCFGLAGSVGWAFGAIWFSHVFAHTLH